MHEMALVRSLVDVVVDHAEKSGTTEVRAVYVTIGYGRDVVEDLMDGLFRYLARGTVAEHAELVLQRVPLTVRCNKCGTIFNIDVFNQDSWTCPTCGAVHDYKLNTGMEFYVNRIEVAGSAASCGEKLAVACAC